MIRVLDMGARREEPQIVPKVKRRGARTALPERPNARARSRAACPRARRGERRARRTSSRRDGAARCPPGKRRPTAAGSSSSASARPTTAAIESPVRAASVSTSAGSWPSARSDRAHGGVGLCASRRRRAGRRAARDDPELVEDVLRGLDELRAFANEPVPAFRERRMDRARQREHFAPLLAGESRGDERAGRQRCLDDEHAARRGRSRAGCGAGNSASAAACPTANSEMTRPRAASSCARSRLRAG